MNDNLCTTIFLQKDACTPHFPSILQTGNPDRRLKVEKPKNFQKREKRTKRKMQEKGKLGTRQTNTQWEK